MKKITLLLLFLLLSVSGYSQLPTEGFESTTGITGPLPTIWTLGTGDWSVFEQNNPGTVGSGQSWGINSFATGEYHSAIQCASVNREQIGQGGVSEDYLATPVVSIPGTGTTELHFWTRLWTSGNQVGTVYKVMVAAAAADQFNPSSYVDVAQWTDLDLIVPVTNYNVWTEKTVTVPAFLAGQDVRFAFVKIYTQPTTALDGDRWLIDDVGVNVQCTAPTVVTPTVMTDTTATLNWSNPSGATSWTVVVTPVAGGTPITYNNVSTNVNFLATGLTSNTQYTFQVSAICPTGFSSPLSTASSVFTTQVAPPVCGGNLVDTGGTAGNYSNNANVSTTVTPAAGNVATITFTQFNTEAGNDILRIYEGTAAVPSALIATLSGTTLPPSYTSTAPGGELTFVFTSNGTTTAPGYAASITCAPAPACRIPTAVAVTNGSITTTSATITWTQPTNPDSSVASVFDVIALPANSPAPNAASVPTANDITPGAGPSYVLTGLTPGTCYDVYIRAVCAGNSGWNTVPVRVCTLVAPPVCGGNFVDSGGSGANYSNNETLTWSIAPIIPGDAVTVTFTAFNTEAVNDILRIYDGPGTGSTLLGTFSGTTLPPAFTSSAPGGQLTFQFISNGTVTAAGWLANVTCAPPPTCARPTAVAATLVNHNSATLSWTQPANPDSSVPTAWQVIYLPTGSPAPTASSTGFVVAGTNPFVLTGLASNTCYDVYVRAVCGTTATSPWSLISVSVCTTTAPPVCGGNYVDSGGPTGNYAINENVTTIICPTNPGDVVTVTFTSFNTEPTWDGIYVYNGNSVSAPQILSSNGTGNGPFATTPGGYWGTTIPCPFTSSSPDGCLTFVFRSDGSVVDPGFVANVTCAPPPVCAAPGNIVASATTFNSTSLTWTQPANADSSVATAWDVFYQPCGQPAPTAATVPQIIATANNPFTLGSLSPGTCYDIYVRANCGATTSVWPCTPTTITTSAAPPICGGNFVDNGGAAAPYLNGSNVTTTICPTNPGDVVTVTFTSFNTEATWDALYVYNGTGTTGTMFNSGNPAGNVPGGLAGGYWGTTIPCAFTSSAADGCLTFVFRSDGSVNNPGWVSNITCAPPPACNVPAALSASDINDVRDDSVLLHWTQPANADGSFPTAWDVYYVACGSPAPTPTTAPNATVNTPPPYNLTGLTASTCYDIYIRANCGTSVSAWTCSPLSITTLPTPPTCNQVFTDTGGSTGAYGNNANIPTHICPTNPGDVVTVTFTSFNTQATVDGLYVYDGDLAGVNQIITNTNGSGTVPGGIPGSYWGNLTGGNLPGPFTSTTADGCLTFVFRSDGFTTAAGWVANVTCAPAPTCARPLAIVANPITQTSATINWVQPANPDGSVATTWQILVLPSPSTTPTGIGNTVTTPTYFAAGLTAGTTYDVYIRAICGPNDYSIWSASTFSTPPLNDECINASFAIVNQNLNCVQTTHGTLVGATASSPPTTCGGAGAANDDVWFTFTATAATHIISFNNVTPATALSYAIYSGTCTGLTEVGCNSGANLVANNTYYIRVFSTGTTPTPTNFDMCIGTLPCTEAPAFCTGQTVTYANNINVPSLGQIGCLFTSPNPAFFFLQVNQAGPLSYLISQVDNNGVGRDVDYVAWGPFTDLNTACSGVPANPMPGLLPALTPAQGCNGSLHACSYSANPTEIMCIPNAQLCEVYVVMITNFSNQPGFVTFTQTNAGGGTTECFPINTFNYPQTYYCQSDPNPTPVLAPAATAGVYSSTPGLVFVDSGTNTNSNTGQINLLASTPGPYVITATTLTSTGGVCTNIPSITTTRTVIITAPANATISYASASYCNIICAAQPVIRTGTTGGTYSATPAGLLLNVNTGEIIPCASTGGNYTITYTVPAFGGCPAFTTTTQVEIIDAPVPTFTQVTPICPGDALADLPTSSNNSPPITGTWSPAIDNTVTTTYTFTPDAGLCAETTTMTINVGSTIPTFNPVAPICPGAPLAALPTTSLNGIDGVWTPALDNTQTTTYHFTPTSGVCVGPATLTIQVLPATVVPTFNAVAPICPNGTLSPLPTTSLNGITGVWSPVLDTTQTTTYTFTPDTGQCGLTTTLTVTVNPPLVVTVNNPTFCPGSSATMVATPAIPGTYTYTWTVPSGVTDPGNVASFVTSTPGNYSVTIDQVSSFCNTDFETPLATGTAPNLVAETLVPCWDTTSADGIIEIWPPGFEGVTAYSGNQLIELNANTPGTLFQDFQVIPGTTMSVSFAHRGRQGVDVVGVEIGPVGGPYVSLGNFSDGNTSWGLHTVNYTIPTGGGTSYTLRFVSVSSTGGSPSIGNLLDNISVSALSCTSAAATGVASLQTLPDPTVTVTDPTCTVPTGSIDVTSPLNVGGLPSNLFISEVTDEDVGSLTYVEIFNGTGATVDLSNYKLKVYNNGSSTASCNNQLAGMLNNNSTWIVAVGSVTNQGGVTPNQVFAGCGGVNTDDNIRLTTSADVEVDLWGTTDGTNFTPANQAGYTYRRLNTATVPSLTWNPADWTALDPQDYTNVGSYTPASATYEYSLDSGTYQSGTTFTGVATGPHTITVHNLATGCYSLPFDVTVGTAVGQLPTVTTITYTTPVCQSSTTPELPNTSAVGFTSGGTYSEITSTGLVINPTTGEITLGTGGSTLGFHTVQYEVLFNSTTCQSYGVSTFIVEIKSAITPIVGFSYTTPICKIAQATLSPTLDPGFTTGGTFSSTTGLSINASTGVIDLANSTAGPYDVTYGVPLDANNCQAATSFTFHIVITPTTTPAVGFHYVSPICAGETVNPLPILDAGFTAGGVFGPTPLVANTATGEVDLSQLTTPGQAYTVTYTLAANPTTCESSVGSSATIMVSTPVVIEASGGCQSISFILHATVNGTFDPNTTTFSWHNDQGIEVGTTQEIIAPAAGTYTVTVTINGCANVSAPFQVDSIACIIQKGISVNNDGFNDTFDLTGFDVKKLTIFNRLGMKVYSQANYVNEWGGKSDNGDELPDGTYFYVIDKNVGDTVTGWIYINRAQ